MGREGYISAVWCTVASLFRTVAYYFTGMRLDRSKLRQKTTPSPGSMPAIWVGTPRIVRESPAFKEGSQTVSFYSRPNDSFANGV